MVILDCSGMKLFGIEGPDGDFVILDGACMCKRVNGIETVVCIASDVIDFHDIVMEMHRGSETDQGTTSAA